MYFYKILVWVLFQWKSIKLFLVYRIKHTHTHTEMQQPSLKPINVVPGGRTRGGGIHKDQGRKSHQLYGSTYKTAQSDHHPHSTSCFPLPSYPSGCAFILTMLFLFFNPPLWSMRFIYLPFNPVFGALLAVLRGSIQESRCQSASKCLKEIRKCKVADWTQTCWLYAKLTTLNNFLRPKSVKKTWARAFQLLR